MRYLIPALCTVALMAAASAQANKYVGDLVYCDVDANGIYDGSDYPLDDVEVRVVCSSGATVCADLTTRTGELHSSVNTNNFEATCGSRVDYDVNDLVGSGRYLFEILGTHSGVGCANPVPSAPPFLCSVTVNPATLPADCMGLVTPKAGVLPEDGNGDLDYCDAEDGPFPEGQILGDNGSDPVACEAFPSPGPGDGVHNALIDVGAETRCALYNDFGYTPEPGSGATRTIGFWKTHPDAVAQFLPLEFCGEPVNEVCDAVELLSAKGGGFGNFSRQSVAAALNCSAFGCSADIQTAIADGNAACANEMSFPYGPVGTFLDNFNNSGDDIDHGLDVGNADPKFCK